MEIDLKQALSDLPRDSHLLRADVCVVGGGIAGLTLAHRLAGLGVDTLLVEVGGRERAADSSADDAVEVLGGTSAVWGGQLLPVAGLEGWPVEVEALEPYTPEIERLLGVDALPYDGTGFFHEFGQSRSGESELVGLAALRARVSKFAPYGRRNLGRSLGRTLLAHPKVRVALHTRAVELRLTPSGDRVDHVVVGTVSGKVLAVRARRFVIAAGTVATCGLLLCSAGSGDALGRNYHDHLTVTAAVFEGAARAAAVESFRPWIVGGLRGTVHSVKLEAGSQGRAETLPAGMAHFVFEEPEGTGIAALREVLRARQQGQGVAGRGRLGELPRAVNDLFSLYACARRDRRRYISPRARVALRLNVEQRTPSASTVRLGDEVDRFGQRTVVLDWRVAAEDEQALRGWARVLQGAMSPHGYRAGEGARWDERLLASEGGLPEVESARHAMGGACMGTDPRSSVVDGDLKVHGIGNLFLASAAVFPDGRAQLPTMTLMALCLRLAEHLGRGAGG